MYLAAIVGTRLKTWRKAPVFFWHSLRSLQQARQAPGQIWAGITARDGVLFSLTVWDSPAAMRAYALTGAHLAAMKAAPRLVKTVRLHHFPCASIPDWNEALDRWRRAEHEARDFPVANPCPAP